MLQSKVAMGKEYQFKEVIGIARRENNPRRQFLFINRNQGKYIPSDPKESIEMFHALGRLAAQKSQGALVSAIGFAETATALGAFAAEKLGSDTYYLHTTRREDSSLTPLIRFEEEHSHATTHWLYCRDEQRFFDSDYIVLFDDEFTTGKTIRNFVGALRNTGRLKGQVRFMAASILNCMGREDMEAFKREGIDWVYLLRKRTFELPPLGEEKTDRAKFQKTEKVNPAGQGDSLGEGYQVLYIPGGKDLCTGINLNRYRDACIQMAGRILEKIGNCQGQRILVLGTEELMYPAILFASLLKHRGQAKQVKVQATARSPILPLEREDYPIRTRERMTSLYDEGLKVNLYNLYQYDSVIVIADAPKEREVLFQDMARALKGRGNEHITLVLWRNGCNENI